MGSLIISGVKTRKETGGAPQVGSYTGEYTVDENGWIRFLTSGELRVKNTAVIDAFLVGGGGAAASHIRSGTSSSVYKYASPGGGGGYTLTKRAFTLYPHKKYSIVIGAGGKYYQANSSTAKDGGRGGTTSAFGVSAEGGYGGRLPKPSEPSEERITKGGDGGSGGGAVGGAKMVDGVTLLYVYAGGVDGADGGGTETEIGGTGQGRTTRAFEDVGGELFASGGDGGYWVALSPEKAGNPLAGAANTGDGGDGDCSWSYYDSQKVQRYSYRNGKSGGSGVVIIRKAVEG